MLSAVPPTPTPTPLSIFSFFSPLPVKLKWSLIQQNWSVAIQAPKINQGTKFATLKKPIISLFDVVIWEGMPISL